MGDDTPTDERDGERAETSSGAADAATLERQPADDASVETDETGDDETDDIEEATVDLTEEELGGGSLFDGVDDTDDPETADSESDESSGSEETTEVTGDEQLAETINGGAARLAVIGLTDADFDGTRHTKTSLETELRETFEAFRLGYFGSQAAEKYVLSPSEGEIDPAWGLLGAAIMAGAITLMMRPDGDEKLDDLRETVSGLTGGAFDG